MIYLSRDGFDWFENRSHSKIDVRFCSITEPTRTIGVRLGSIDFWFDFIRLDTPGVLSDARRQEIRINALSEDKRNEIDKVF